MQKARGKAFWQRLVREVEGGESQASVARRHGVSISWLGRWCKQLRGQAAPALLPVRVVEAPARRFEVAAGGVRLSFEEGTDASYVATVIRAITS